MVHLAACSLLSSLLLGSSAAAADVLVVDAAGAGEFLTLTGAVVAASPGDVLLVRAGGYAGPVAVDGIGLVIVADVAGTVSIDQGLSVTNVPAGSSVVLSGLELLDGFELTGCQGMVQVQDCTAPRNTVGVHAPSSLGFQRFAECGVGLSTQVVRSCDEVVMTRCNFEGEAGRQQGLDGSPGHHGLLVEDSSVLLFDCTLSGGDGGDAQFGFGHGSVWGGAGGDGLQVTGPNAHVAHEDLIAVGGAGALSPNTFDVSGCDGDPIRGGPVEAFSRGSIAFTAPAILRGSQPGTFQVSGPAGAPIIFMSNAAPFWRPLGLTTGSLLIANPLRISVHGPIPSSGVLDVPIAANDPATEDDFFRFHFQAMIFDSGRRLITEPRFVVALHRGL